MNILQSLFSHYYVIPFGAALLTASRRSLAVFAGAFVALALWLNLQAGSAAGAQLYHALLLVMTVTGGLLSGTRARAVLLALPRRKRNAVIMIAAFTAGFSMLPGLHAAAVVDAAQTATIKLREWEMRPPSPACMASTFPAMISGATFHLPPAPVITIRAGKQSHHFQFNNAVRALCSQFRDAGAPIRAENLNFDFSIPVRATFCGAAKSRWGRSLCDPRSADNFPDIANIYSPLEYDNQRILDSHTYADFVAEQKKAKSEGHPLEPQQVGSFNRYANGYWVGRTEAWKNDAGEPYTLKCEESAQPGALSCTASYRLKIGPQVTYHFSAPVKKLEAAARRIDQNFRMMIAEMTAP